MKFINKLVEKILDINFYKLVFLVSCFFYCIPFTNDIFSKLFKIFIFWGILIFIFNYFYNKKYTLKKIDYLLFCFLIVAFISCIINYKFNLITNIISVLYLFVQMILMISYNREKKLEEKIKEQKLFANIIVVLTFICSVFSLLIFLLNIKISYADGFQQIIFGVFEGRLWGFYANPNSLGQFALVSIWLSVLLLSINNKKLYKIFLYVNILFEFICLVLANSRSSLLGLIISVGLYAILMIALKKKKEKQSIGKSIWSNKFNIIFKLAVIAVFIILGSTLLKRSMVFGAKIFDGLVDNKIFIAEVNNGMDSEENIEEKEDEGETIKVDREYQTSDVSNGRFELWNAGLKVFFEHPLFGVGTKNINHYANQHISFNTLLTAPKLSENMHNIYLQVLVAHGIIGFLIFIFYIAYIMVKYLVNILKYNFDKIENNKLIFKSIVVNFTLLCALLVINFFDSNIMYFCSVFFTFVFWNSISSINSMLDLVEKEDEIQKILFLVDSLDNGGIEKALVDLTNKIKNKNYEIHVKTIYNEGIYISKLDKNIKYSSVIKKPNIWKKRVFYRLVKHLPSKILYHFCITDNYDVEIAFHELLATKILSGSASNSYKIAWVHTNVFTNENSYQMFYDYIDFVKGYSTFDKIVCVSDNIRNEFNEKTKLYQKTITIYNPIDKENIIKLSQKNCSLKKQKGKFLVVSVGRLEKVKGYHKLCNAINNLKDKYKNLELWLIGEGKERENLEKYVKDNNLEDYIKLLGFKENPYKYLKQADLFISTSEIEGFSLVVAEAIALGIPVISTDTDGPKEILDHGHYGMLIEKDEDAIYNALNQVLSDKKVLNDLKEGCRKRQNYFDIADTINAFNKLVNLNINKKYDVFCTVFTPTYNRAYTLDKLYESLKKQTFKDFEWVVVDDGSTDNTEKLIEKWQKEKKDFEIIYIKVRNGGKQKAVNIGLELAQGKMFFIVDSDDYITDEAIEKIKEYEITISKDGGFAGVAGLKGYDLNKPIGSYISNKWVDCCNLERDKYNLNGDKAEVYYTDILKKYKFPEVKQEKFVTERVVWDEIANSGYKLRWFNDIICICDYLEDGLTSNATALYQKNPIGYLIFIRNQVTYNPFDIKQKIGNYYRYYKLVKDKKSFDEIADDLLTNYVFLKLVVFVNKIKGV